MSLKFPSSLASTLMARFGIDTPITFTRTRAAEHDPLAMLDSEPVPVTWTARGGWVKNTDGAETNVTEEGQAMQRRTMLVAAKGMPYTPEAGDAMLVLGETFYVGNATKVGDFNGIATLLRIEVQS